MCPQSPSPMGFQIGREQLLTPETGTSTNSLVIEVAHGSCSPEEERGLRVKAEPNNNDGQCFFVFLLLLFLSLLIIQTDRTPKFILKTQIHQFVGLRSQRPRFGGGTKLSRRCLAVTLQ